MDKNIFLGLRWLFMKRENQFFPVIDGLTLPPRRLSWLRPLSMEKSFNEYDERNYDVFFVMSYYGFIYDLRKAGL